MLTLHYFPGAISAAVAIALFEADAAFTAVKVDFTAKEQQGAAYLALNPKGRVPTLVTPQGALTETAAVLDYIGATHPGAGLIPSDPYDAARMRSVMTYLASTMHVNHAHKTRGHRWADKPESWEDMAAKVPQTMADCARYIEDHAIDGPFVLGDAVSLADPYLYVVSTWLAGDKVDIAQFPKFAAFQSAMRDRPSVQKAMAEGYL
jgi:glutathione S-transferase